MHSLAYGGNQPVGVFKFSGKLQLVQNIQLSYSLHPASQPRGQIYNPLMALLHAVQAQGSISAAARTLDLSYRHVWGELKRWEAELGETLLVWDRGQAARLSPFGSKLMYAERQAQARLTPQIEALQAELERSFAMAFEAQSQVVSLYASHDEALSQLRVHCAKKHLHLDITFMGSVDAIRALNEGRCVMAGFHTTLPAQRGTLAQRTYQPLLQPGVHKIIGFAQRMQGLVLPPGNPKGVRTLADVRDKNLRLSNRALGTGTRLLLDELLAQLGIKPSQITGYRHTEPSHSAVAQAIAQGSADVGIGIEAAAAALGLDFVPLVQERYDLVCLKSALLEPTVVTLRKTLQSAAWRRQLNGIQGYGQENSGKVLSLTKTLPWWQLDGA
jgi:putative molybdopterin biosynthesis protein